MSKIKSIIIYILSVLLAFESGVFMLVVCMVMGVYGKENESKKTKNYVSYRNYNRERA